MLMAAESAGVDRFVYTSTVGCIGIPSSGIGDEAQPVTLGDMSGAYKRSKFMAEQVAMEAGRGGMRVITVNPTTPVGEQDVKPTPTGRIVVDFLKRKFPAYVETGLNLVDVKECARGHIAALEKGKTAERYKPGPAISWVRTSPRHLTSSSRIPPGNWNTPGPPAGARRHVSSADC